MCLSKKKIVLLLPKVSAWEGVSRFAAVLLTFKRHSSRLVGIAIQVPSVTQLMYFYLSEMFSL